MIVEEEGFVDNISDVSIQSKILGIIYRHLNDFLFIMKYENDEFRYIFTNEKSLEVLGLSETPRGKTFYDVLPQDKADSLKIIYEEAILHKQSIEFMDDHTLFNGELIHAESIITPIVNSVGECEYIICITRDITERVKKENQLLENKLRFQSLFVHNLDAVLSVDSQGNIFNVNKVGVDLLGYPLEEIENRNILRFIDFVDSQEFLNLFAMALIGKSLELKKIRLKAFAEKEIFAQLKLIPTVLHGEIVGLYIVLRDITEQIHQEEAIRQLAYCDALTGLGNRVALMDNLKMLTKSSNSEEKRFALLYCDLDRFKLMNDSFGHTTGDILLKEVANRLISIMDYNYSVYRQGGDEFIILIEESDKEIISNFASKIIDLFNSPFKIEDQDFYFSVSIGISVYPTDSTNPYSLIKNADYALYNVKDNEKGSFEFYKNDMNKNISYSLEIESGMRKAINNNEFFICYQPQFDVNTKKTKSLEALIRWNNPSFGLVPPLDFIPIAEETGYIINIGEWVIFEVCKQLAEWKEKSYNLIPVAINISTRHFKHISFINALKRALDIFEIDPGLIEIEITERAMMNFDESVIILDQLKTLGVNISIDDFGTGYSTLSYLKNLPLDTIKIDRSFIQEISKSEKDEMIIKLISDLARNLGMRVIAEGVEEESQIHFLKRISCDTAQGFLYSRPILAEEVASNFLNKTTT
jgi:diguanylate cyclase (GGDEF)-like protein/PAS domain S-box-containing protein